MPVHDDPVEIDTAAPVFDGLPQSCRVLEFVDDKGDVCRADLKVLLALFLRDIQRNYEIESMHTCITISRAASSSVEILAALTKVPSLNSTTVASYG